MTEPSASSTGLAPRLVETILTLAERSGLDAAGIAEILQLDVTEVQTVLTPPTIGTAIAPHDSDIVVPQATSNSTPESGPSGVKRKLSRKEQEEGKKAKREQRKQEVRRGKERAEESRVDDLPAELCCSHKLVISETGELLSCFEGGEYCCAICHDLLCVAHIFVTVETLTAKPVVKKGRKPPEVEYSDYFCKACACEHKIEGKLNESYGAFQYFEP